jgi:hypothetical protein
MPGRGAGRRHPVKEANRAGAPMPIRRGGRSPATPARRSLAPSPSTSSHPIQTPPVVVGGHGDLRGRHAAVRRESAGRAEIQVRTGRGVVRARPPLRPRVPCDVDAAGGVHGQRRAGVGAGVDHPAVRMDADGRRERRPSVNRPGDDDVPRVTAEPGRSGEAESRPGQNRTVVSMPGPALGRCESTPGGLGGATGRRGHSGAGEELLHETRCILVDRLILRQRAAQERLGRLRQQPEEQDR